MGGQNLKKFAYKIMEKIKRTIKDLRDFCLHNGYLFAAYRKVSAIQRDWLLQNTEANYDEETYPDDMIILCNLVGCGVSYCETVSEDNVFVFRLHNNYNLPQTIPCF